MYNLRILLYEIYRKQFKFEEYNNYHFHKIWVRYHYHFHGDHQHHHLNKRVVPASGDSPGCTKCVDDASPATAVINNSGSRRWFKNLSSGRVLKFSLDFTFLRLLLETEEMDRKGVL